MSFKSQLFGFMKRNYKLKIRNKFQSISEIYNMLTILAVLILFSFLFKPKILDPVRYDAVPLTATYLTSINVYMAPFNEDVAKIGNLIKSNSRKFNIWYFNNSNEMREAYNNNQSNGFGVEFNNNNFPFEYNLYNTWDDLFYSKNKINLFGDSRKCRESYSLMDCAGNKVIYNGLSLLQYYLDLSIKQFQNSSLTLPMYKVQNVPKASYLEEQPILTAISSYYFTLFFQQSLNILVTKIVAEKENKIKENMRIMGMSDSAFWLSWVLTYILPLTILNIFVSILMIATGYFRTFNLTIIFFVLFELYSITTINFGMMFSTFFQKSKTAGSACSFVYLLSSLLYFCVFLPRQLGSALPIVVQWFLSLVFPCAFSLSIDQALFLQAVYGNSFPLDLIVKSIRPDAMPLIGSIVMLTIDAVLYFVLTIYFDNVIQGEYGRARPLYYFLMPSYWLRTKKVYGTTNPISIQVLNDENSEDISDELKNKEVLKIRNLVKKFKNEENIFYNAIDDLTLNVYPGQITAILGHNGAGKTTLFNILSGLIKSDSGSATFYNYDITSTNDLTKIRKMTGICPQQDILYNDLNCYEHLELYANLKGLPKDQMKSKITELLEKLDLINDKNKLASNLSGGMKRKLCIAISLIGDPQFLILDEPTSGMDPQSRRAVWELLQNLRNNRVVLLATHFMDEADILADRKAIITKGRLRCVGSSLFLKNKFGVGYHLNCLGKNNFQSEPLNLTEFIKNDIPNSELEKYNGRDISYTLPLNMAPKFPKLFENLENSIDSLGLDNFSISMTTLEEVFLKLGEENGDFLNKTNENSSNIGRSQIDLNINSNEPTDKPKPTFKSKIIKFISPEIYAIIKLRWLLVFRNKLSFIYRFILPLPFIIFTIILPKFFTNSNNYDPNNLPYVNLPIDNYATIKNPFVLINSTNLNLDFIIKDNLIVNSNLTGQTIKLINNTDDPNMEIYSGVLFEKWTNRNNHGVTLIYNDSALFSMTYLINTLSNMYSRYDKTNLIKVNITTWPKSEQSIISYFDSSSFSSMIILGTALVLPLVTFAVEIVHERELKCRSQLRLNGCSFSNYWLTSFFCYLVQYSLLPILLFIFIYSIPQLNIPAFNPGGARLTIFLTTIIYIPCVLLVALCASFLFNKKETSIGVLSTAFTLLFTIPFLIVNLTQISGLKTSNILHIVFCLIDPIYGFVGTYSRITQVFMFQQIKDSIFNKKTTTVPFELYFEFENFFIPLSLIFGVINLIFYAFLLYFIESYKHGINLFEYYFNLKSKNTESKRNYEIIENEDYDVNQERQLIMQSNTILNNCPLVLKELHKDYSKQSALKKIINVIKYKKISQTIDRKVAVRNLSLGFKKGEIFGLLGPNGAGKTTTMSIITADVKPDAGLIQILGENLNLANLKSFYENVGFCPQNNPLWDEITLKEHLILYASIKKINPDRIVSICEEFMNRLEIFQHADKRSKVLSGGTKRKLVFAMSMLNFPNIGLLDEPSTGMDPQSKRKFWNLINHLFTNENKTAILTTHSMEEAEALCQRIGIMAKGELKCLGSTQYLKEKFGAGYIFETKINIQHQKDFFELVSNLFMNKATINESFSNRFIYNIPNESFNSLANVFEQLEKAKSNGIICEYGFSQCTLEQIFIKFAKEQH